MSVKGIGGIATAILRPQEMARPKTDQDRAAQVGGAATPAAPAQIRPGGLLAPRQDALPVEAPAGTDPELWQVLTPAERTYFAKLTGMGPLTYGRPSSSVPASETPLGRGGRLDVRA
jgi:hypothetical protein